MKPWDIKRTGKPIKDEILLPLWANFKPRDFYFASTYEDDTNTTIVYLVPKEYFDKRGFMYEDSMPITKYLPDYLIETVECVYEAVNKNEVSVRKDLFDSGFDTNPFFQSFIDNSMLKRGTV